MATNLRPWQAAVIWKALHPGLNYLFRLKSRMEKTGFRRDDPFYLMVVQAYDAVYRLSMELHYRSFDKSEASDHKA
jgi:hypothetical protein